MSRILNTNKSKKHLGLAVATSGLVVLTSTLSAHGSPVTVNGAPFILVATNSSGVQLAELTVDAQGRVYAGNNSNSDPGVPVQEFDPSLFTGTPVPFQNLGPTCQDGDGIAFGNGFIFVADANVGVRKVAISNGAASVFIPGVAENGTGSPLAYRPADGHLFVGLGGLTGIDRITEYDASGTFVTNHVTGTDVETMTFDPGTGLIYYAAYGSTVRSLDPITGTDQLVGTVDGTIDGALAVDSLSHRLFVGMANGGNPGFIQTIDLNSGAVASFASGFSSALGIALDPLSGNLYFLEDHDLYMLKASDVDQSIPPVAIKITWTNSVATTTWQVSAGGSYQLQYTPQLEAPAWTNVTSVFTAVSNQLDLIDSGATNAQGFYRAAVVH